MMRTATWNNVGKNISEATNVKEALQFAGLDYEVIKAPVYLSSKKRIEGKFATKIKGTDEVFGIVGKDFQLVQNEDAFEFVNHLVPEGLKFVKAGMAANNNLVYMIAKLPERKIVDEGIEPYVIFQNSHSGFTTLKAAIAPLRIVCQNQFKVAFREAKDSISLRHTKNINGKLHEAQEVLSLSAGYMDTVKKESERLAAIKLSDEEAIKIVNSFYDYDELTATERTKNSMEEQRRNLLNIYNNTEDLANYHGTAYGLFQSYADMITHADSKRKTKNWEESRFITVTFNPNYMNKLVSIINEFA